MATRVNFRQGGIILARRSRRARARPRRKPAALRRTNLGFRIAGYFSDMQGWTLNLSADLPATANQFPSNHSRTPNQREWTIRGTLKWEVGGMGDVPVLMNGSKATAPSVAVFGPCRPAGGGESRRRTGRRPAVDDRVGIDGVH